MFLTVPMPQIETLRAELLMVGIVLAVDWNLGEGCLEELTFSIVSQGHN